MLRPDRHPDAELVFEVVHGLADRADAADVMAHVRSCASCAELVRSLARTREAARIDLPPTPAAGRRPVSAAPDAGKWRISRYLPVAVLAAAVVAAVMVPGPWSRRSGIDATPTYWLVPELQPVVKRSTEIPLPAGLVEALDKYEAHDLDGAVAALQDLAVDGAWASYRDIYLGAALVNAGRYADAAPVLARLDIPTLPYEYKLPAQWYEYVVLAHTGRADEARRLLDSLRRGEGPVAATARAEWDRLATAQGRP